MFLCLFFWREQTATVFALKRTSLDSVLDYISSVLALLRLEEVWKSFSEHTKRVDV